MSNLWQSLYQSIQNYNIQQKSKKIKRNQCQLYNNTVILRHRKSKRYNKESPICDCDVFRFLILTSTIHSKPKHNKIMLRFIIKKDKSSLCQEIKIDVPYVSIHSCAIAAIYRSLPQHTGITLRIQHRKDVSKTQTKHFFINGSVLINMCFYSKSCLLLSHR